VKLGKLTIARKLVPLARCEGQLGMHTEKLKLLADRSIRLQWTLKQQNNLAAAWKDTQRIESHTSKNTRQGRSGNWTRKRPVGR